jgi:hypothetical protein
MRSSLEQARFEEFFHEGAATDRIEAMRGWLSAVQ